MQIEYWKELSDEFLKKRCKSFNSINKQEIISHNNKLFTCLYKFEEIDRYGKFVDFIKTNYSDLEKIIIYHDIGKLISTNNHENEGYKILKEANIGNELLRMIVRDHLMLGCIFNGEWSIKCLYKAVSECKKLHLDVKRYLDLLLVISVIDAWAYVHNIRYIRRLFLNYLKILNLLSSNNEEVILHENMLWRFTAFCGSYKCINYMQENEIERYIKLIEKNIFIRLYDNPEIIQEKMGRINFGYASWMFCRFAYRTLIEYKKLRFEDIVINENMCLILNDIFDIVDKFETNKYWYVFFEGYRGTDNYSENIFSKLTDIDYINKVIGNKQIAIYEHDSQIVYNFGG